MESLINEDFLLGNGYARELYHESAEKQPFFKIFRYNQKFVWRNMTKAYFLSVEPISIRRHLTCWFQVFYLFELVFCLLLWYNFHSSSIATGNRVHAKLKQGRGGWPSFWQNGGDAYEKFQFQRPYGLRNVSLSIIDIHSFDLSLT